MYNYEFEKNNESIVKEATNVNVKVDNKYYQTNFVLTEKNLLIFYDANMGNPVWGMGTHPLPELYLLFSIPKNDVKIEKIENNLYIIVDNKKINCYSFDLEYFLK